MRHTNTRHQRLLQFVRGVLRAPMRRIERLGRDRRGGTLVFVALAIVPLVAFVGLAIDTTRGYLVKSRLSQAIDAAALAGGRVYTSATRDDDIRMFFKANFPDGYMDAVTTPLTITPNDVNRTLTVSAQATLPTSFMHLVDIDSISVASATEITIAAQNVEVALVLDITGSMAGSKIAGLRDAANTLIDIVVQDQQTPYYTKVAVVPYSQGVNVGATYAPQVRGVMPTKAITNITKANPAVVTSIGHGFSTGDKVVIQGVGGMTQANNNLTSTGTATSSPSNFWVVQKLTNDTFSLKKCNNTTTCNTPANVSSTAWSNYTANTGTVSCTTVGCPYLTFQRDSDNTWRTWLITNCVTERVGANAYTDAAPSTAFVGPRYEMSGGVSGNSCITNPVIQPLSSDKTLLHNKINALVEGGSTAGQIGVAWGWYMLSPKFSYLWPSISQPAAYGTPQLLKVAVIMTDGDFNTVYNMGIIAQDAGSGSGSSADKINQNATNGSAITQAQALCSAMKAPAPGANIEIFTVGLELPNQSAIDIMNYCATDAAHVYLPASGADMHDVFKDIAMKISRLRLSK